MKEKDFFKTNLLLFLVLLFYFFNLRSNVNLIVFSFDRPLQLYAFLESAQRYLLNLDKLTVIYRTSNAYYSNAYEQVKNRFHIYKFFKQEIVPYNNFKDLTIQAINESCDYLIFAVDDIIITDFVNVKQCEELLKQTKSYGFYLRLGHNIRECYMQNIKTPVPINELVQDDIYIYKFNNGKGDWFYPNSLDMVIYNKKEIINQIKNLHFSSPNKLEGEWSLKANLNKYGLFFKESKIVNIPLNLVNENFRKNKNSRLFSANDLLKKFQDGLKIEIDGLYKIQNKSTHIDFVPKFIKRGNS